MSEALTLFPLGFDPPGARWYTSSPSNRSPMLLLSILAEHQLRGVGRYEQRDVDGDGKRETWCNVHSCDVAEAMGVVLPRGKRANELVLWLSSLGGDFGWEKTTAHVARAAADEGMAAFVAWYNPNYGPGHIAPLQPSLGVEGLWCSNVGAFNALRTPVSRAFGSLHVDFFVHP